MKRVGILGGGQLAKMMIQAGSRLALEFWVLDPDECPPAAPLAHRFIQAEFSDESAVRTLVSETEVTTYDIEHLDSQLLKHLEGHGYALAPAPELLELIQDKGRQREFLASRGIPGPRFALTPARDPEEFRQFGYPLVQKLRRGGYDGRAVRILESEADWPDRLVGESLIEERVELNKELAALVVRSPRGELVTYPVVEMIFSEQNLLDTLVAPADISPEIEKQALKLGCEVVDAFGGVGVFAIELFLTTSGALLVNEVAPRPHNSGHFTIEACPVSQFENHLRAILNLPLGRTELKRPAALVNLLGEPSSTGRAEIVGLEAALGVEDCSVHLYGKRVSRPHRKMGHVTCLGSSRDEAARRAREVRAQLTIRGRSD